MDHLANTRQVLDSVSGSFCLAKWHFASIDLENGRTSSCHSVPSQPVSPAELQSNPAAAHNSAYNQARWQEMLRGERHTDCRMCWSAEERGLVSERLLRSGDRLDQTDRTLQQMVSGEPFVPETLEIFLTSNCNFKCIYCNPKISSAWRQEISIYGALDLGAGHILHAPETTDLRRRSSPDGPAALESAFWEWWPTLRSRVRRLKLTGGEPLLSPTTLEFLKRIEREGFPQGELSVNTNLGVSALVMDRFLNALTLSRPAMNRLVIQTSMEAVGDRAEYLRTGLKWDEWQTNLQRLLKSDVVDQVVITSTMNVLCALYYQEFIEFVKELNRCYPGKLIVSAPWLVSPEFLAVEILPRHLVPHLEGLSESAEGCSAFGATAQSQIQNLERFFTTRPEQPRDVFKRRQLGLYLQALDQRRHSSAQRAFPLLASF